MRKYPVMNDSLLDAQMFVSINRQDGVICPCCGVRSKVYKVAMNRTYVKALGILIDKADAAGIILVGQESLGKLLCHDLNHYKYSKLAHWGLIHKVQRGMWAITDLGRAFSRGEQNVSAWITEMRGKCIDHSAEQVSLVEAMERGFDYEAEVLG